MVIVEKKKRGRPVGSTNSGPTARTQAHKIMLTMDVGQVSAFFPKDERELRNLRQSSQERWTKKAGWNFVVWTCVIVRGPLIQRCVMIERTA